MAIIRAKDKRSGITYAYKTINCWDGKSMTYKRKRTLLGRVDPETGEIIATDGRCQKLGPYKNRHLETKEEIIAKRIKSLSIPELRKEIIRLELELQKIKSSH